MGNSYGSTDDENACLLNREVSAPRSGSYKMPTRRLGDLQLLVAIPCLVLAITFPKLNNVPPALKQYNNNNSSSENSDPMKILEKPTGLKMNRLCICMTAIACLLALNGIIGIISSWKRAVHCLNLVNFFLGTLNVVISLVGIMICIYAAYWDGIKHGSKHSAWYIAGMQASCYVGSIASLGAMFNCWLQMDSKTCAWHCTCLGVHCAYGEDRKEEGNCDCHCKGNDSNESDEEECHGYDEPLAYPSQNPTNGAEDDYVDMHSGQRPGLSTDQMIPENSRDCFTSLSEPVHSNQKNNPQSCRSRGETWTCSQSDEYVQCSTVGNGAVARPIPEYSNINTNMMSQSKNQHTYDNMEGLNINKKRRSVDELDVKMECRGKGNQGMLQSLGSAPAHVRKSREQLDRCYEEVRDIPEKV